MTTDQVLLDEAPASGAVASQTEAKPKPVRRRTTKKVETVEQPTLPETTASGTPAVAATAPEAPPAPEKPKRTRTRVLKAKTPASATPTETPASGADVSPTTAPTVEAPTALQIHAVAGPSAPSVETPAAETQVAAQRETNQGEVQLETPAIEAQTPARPSIPARFPSRFKRTEEPKPEAAPRTEPQAPVEVAPVSSDYPGTPRVEQPTETPEVAPRVEAEVSAPQTSEPFVEAPANVEARDQNGAPDAPPTEGAQENQNGEFNGELPEGGFGRMRYRERREFRRQQRLQQRQERFGPNGEPLPFPEARPQDGRPQEGRPGDGRQPDGRQPGQNGGFNRGNNGGNGFAPYPPRRRELDFFSLKALGDEELENFAREYGLEPDDSRGRDALVLAVMEAQARAQNAVLKTGILDAHDHNKAFLRCEGFTPSEQDVYVSQTQIKRFNLKSGDLVFGTARAPKENERFFGLLRVESINGLSPEELRSRKDFEKLTPIFPDERFKLETEQTNITARLIDLVSPIGKGTRGLIIAPPKAGKTTLMKSIANSITINNPESELFVLLIDERPEEVTDISRSVKGTVVASTFDETPENHMRVADIVMERAKRLVEMKQDVVILLDNITRLSRASNLVVTPSGRTLSGGLDPAAMYKPKRMFGAARNIEEGGSLTILATALVDTGSRMDEMIFEEFKGTGNMDLVLDRDLFNQRIFPAIDINKSGTRRDDLLMSKDELAATFHLRQTLARLDNDQAVKLLIDRLKNTRSNANFMEVVAKSARQAEVKGT